MASTDAVWSDEVDAILGGDLTAGLAYVTPAGGVVLTAVAPIGLRDRDRGTVGFTTSLGFGRKLERIAADPRVALAYHTREHGQSAQPGLVVVQGRAAVEPDRPELRDQITSQAAAHLGAIKQGWFWDRWLSAYYADRVVLTVTVERILRWAETRGAGAPTVIGPALPPSPSSQPPPAKGTAARASTSNGSPSGSGPVTACSHGGVPTATRSSSPSTGSRPARACSRSMPPRPSRPRAGGGPPCSPMTTGPSSSGCAAGTTLGWLEAGPADGDRDGLRFAPHTVGGFVAPPNKTLLLLANGYLARRGLKRARAAGRG